MAHSATHVCQCTHANTHTSIAFTLHLRIDFNVGHRFSRRDALILFYFRVCTRTICTIGSSESPPRNHCNAAAAVCAFERTPDVMGWLAGWWWWRWWRWWCYRCRHLLMAQRLPLSLRLIMVADRIRANGRVLCTDGLPNCTYTFICD